GREFSDLEKAPKIPLGRIMNRARNIYLPLLLARDGESNKPHEIADRKYENVTLVANVRRQDKRDEEVGMIEISLELVLSEKAPRRIVEERTLPIRPHRIELSIFDLDFAVEWAVLVSSPKNQVNLVNVEKARVGIPTVLEELELGVGLTEDLVMTSASSNVCR